MPGGTDPEVIKEELRRRAPKLLVQAVNEAAASNEYLVELMAAQTIRAASTGNLLARKQEVDLLLRLGGTTQISAALESVGAKKGKPAVLVVSGDDKDIDAVARHGLLGWERVQRHTLDTSELRRIEDAALLNTLRS